MPPHSSEFLLQFLQHFITRLNRNPNPQKIKETHSLLITNGYLLHNPNSRFKWTSTLLFNALIRAYLNLHQPHTTFLLFTHMLAHQAPPNAHTFPPLVKAASSIPTLRAVLGKPLHTQAIKRGVLSDPFIQTSLLSLYAQIGILSSARKVFDEMSHPCVVSYNAMIDALCKSRDMGSAVLLFDSMPNRDVFSWTGIINGYGKNGCFDEAIQFFSWMMVHKDLRGCFVRPNEATFVSVLSACVNSARGYALCQGKQIHGYIIKNEVEMTVFVGTALIDLYGKMGGLGYAMKLFDKMVVKEVCTWNAMIGVLALNGKENEALNMFEKMKVGGWHPNGITFVTVLTACARAQLVELGMEIFQSMSQLYGVVPRMEHYGCVVDLFGRAGFLTEANEFMRRMPFEPDASILGALLGACKVHGAIELGNEIARRLVDLQPWNSARYILLSSINAQAERWDHAAALRENMLDACIQKIPAYSMIDSSAQHKVLGAIELGNEIARRLVDLQP